MLKLMGYFYTTLSVQCTNSSEIEASFVTICLQLNNILFCIVTFLQAKQKRLIYCDY